LQLSLSPRSRNSDITGIGVRFSVYIQSLLVVVISYAVQRRGEGYKDLTSMWRVQLFNYVAFAIALVSLAAKNELSSFNKLAALHLTYMNLVSALTGSQLVHPTYFVYSRSSTRRRRTRNTVVVTFIRVVGGLLPAVVVTFSLVPQSCVSLQDQTQEIETFSWIVLFAVHVGQGVAYALILSFACVVLLLHVMLGLLSVPEGIQHFMGHAEPRLSRFVSGRKQRVNDLAFVAFFLYWIEDVVAIERSLVVNFGYNVKAQNDWGFGQILSFVLLYPVLEALWSNVMFPILFPANRRTGTHSGQIMSPGPTAGGRGEGVDNADVVQLAGVVVVDDEKDVTQLETHWHDPYHPLSMPFNGSKSSFPASFSTASLSPTIRS